MVNNGDRGGVTPLAHACSSGCLPLARLLLKMGADAYQVMGGCSPGWSVMDGWCSASDRALLAL